MLIWPFFVGYRTGPSESEIARAVVRELEQKEKNAIAEKARLEKEVKMKTTPLGCGHGKLSQVDYRPGAPTIEYRQ